MPDRRHPHASGPFAGMTAAQVDDLDDLVFDGMITAYVGPHDVDAIEESSAEVRAVTCTAVDGLHATRVDYGT